MTDEEIEEEAQAVVDQWEEKNRRREMGLPDEDDDQPSFAAELIDATDGGWLDLHPREAFFFWATNPGSEPLLLGLARYPAVVQHTVKGEPDTFETGLGIGWHWEGFCKTQYASLPSEGGEPNFLRTHKAITQLLDHAQTLGLTVEVHDDSSYWLERDDDKLLADLHQYNAMVAGIAGRLKDAGHPTQSPILGHPAFEHLEADGEKAFQQWRDARRAKPDDEAE